MTPTARDHPISTALAWASLGAAMIGVGFAAHPIRASGLVFWTLVGIGGVITAAASVPLLRRGSSRKQLLADECRRIHAALASFLQEQEGNKPKPGRFGNSQDRLGQWRAETESRYERELRPWATRVFDEAVAAEAVSSSSRPLLGAGNIFQLRTLRDLFRDAADSLERDR